MKYSRPILCLIIGFALFISLRTLTSQPRYFYDEAVVLETAHNLGTNGKLDILVNPNTFSGYAHLFNSTGYTVSLPLAIIFKLGGVSLAHGRLLMVAWLIIAILSLFYISKVFWGTEAGIMTVALLASFAPFYGNGMQVMGEVPGFVFLLWGLYQLFHKKNYKLAGLLMSLAAITKPSMYGLLLPAFLIYIIFLEKDKFFKLKDFIIACIGPIVLFFLFIMPNILSSKNWLEIIKLYRNPYDSPSLINNVISNIQTYWHHSTILYIGLLLAMIIYFIFKNYKKIEPNIKNLYSFSFIYIGLLILYFLRSPGWFRYLFPVELLAFMFIYSAISLKSKKLATYVVSFLVIINLGQLGFYRGDIKDDSAQDTAKYITDLNQSVGIINTPEVSSLVPSEKRYQVIKYFGVPELGLNPILFKGDQRTQLIVFKSADNPLVVPYQNILNSNYQSLNQIGSYRIYELK